MTLGDGFPAASGTVDSTELRKSLAGLIVRNTAGAARPGVFLRHTNALVTSRSDMKVDVAAFEGVAVRNGGVIFLANDGTVQVTISAAPGSNSRYTVVWFRQDESALGDGDNLPVLGTTDGTAAASPSKPAIPAGAVELATLLIPAGAAATNAVGVTITNTFAYTALASAEIPVHGVADLSVVTGDAAMNLYPTGSRARDISSGITYRWNGTTWKAWSSDWIAYTPTLTGVAVGTGGSANTASYRYVDGQVKVRGVATLGSSGASVSGTIIVTLPVNAATLRHPYQQYTGSATFYDLSAVQNYFAAPTANNASVSDINILSFYGTNGLRAGTGASTPFIWAAGDSISYDFTYDPA